MHQWKTQTVAISNPTACARNSSAAVCAGSSAPGPPPIRAAGRYSKHDWASHGQKPGKRNTTIRSHLVDAPPCCVASPDKGLAPPSKGAGNHRGPGGPSPLTSVGKLFKLDSLSLETKSSDVD